VQIAETSDRLGPVLVRARTPFLPADRVEGPFTDPVVLLRAPYRVAFSYAGADRVWKEAWVGGRELPVAVRFTIRDARTQRTLTASTATTIHARLPALCAGPKGDGRCGRVARQEDDKPGVAAAPRGHRDR
jgi:general secretion pathway protein J